MDWEVGQEIYIVPHGMRQTPSTAVITKISRKWMTLDKKWLGPINKEDGSQKPDPGYGSRAQAWPSKDVYEKHEARKAKWGSICRSISYDRLPEHLSDFDLDLIIDLVRGDARLSQPDTQRG